MSIYYNGDEKRILIASRYSKKVEVYVIMKSKGCKLHCKFDLKDTFNIIDICYYNPENLLIKYVHDNEVKELDRKGGIVREEVVKLPIKKVRQHGWAQVLLQGKSKVYWYLVG